ncbi:MAG: nitroreductase family protein [Candidatus Aenigmatarchaeota archaeon]
METLECIHTRTCIRRFKSEDIDDETIKRLIEAAIQAPSAGNTQDWIFIVVRNIEIKKQIATAALEQDFIAQAPAVIVVASNIDAITKAYGERGRSLYSIQDTAAAVQNLLLAAWDRGLGACWVGAFSEKAISDILALPSYVRPLAIIPIGMPAHIPKKPGRKAIKDVIHWEHW